MARRVFGHPHDLWSDLGASLSGLTWGCQIRVDRWSQPELLVNVTFVRMMDSGGYLSRLVWASIG